MKFTSIFWQKSPGICPKMFVCGELGGSYVYFIEMVTTALHNKRKYLPDNLYEHLQEVSLKRQKDLPSMWIDN